MKDRKPVFNLTTWLVFHLSLFPALVRTLADLYAGTAARRVPAVVLVLTGLIVFIGQANANSAGDTPQEAFFESRVRPLLIKRCGVCHGADSTEGNLNLTTIAGIANGGPSGAIVVPGHSDQSRLIQAVRYTSKLKMPPEKRLSDNEIQVLKSWVRSGAVVPDSVLPSAPARTRDSGRSWETEREWWAFQPVQKQTPPAVTHIDRVRTPIDRFILYKLEQNGLTFSPDADRPTGLLDETLVVWCTEFGRTPEVQFSSGRDHHQQGFTFWLAGGGIKGGLTYGATDEFGYHAVENPVLFRDLHATILHVLGLDHRRLTFRSSGRDFRLTDIGGKVLTDVIT